MTRASFAPALAALLGFAPVVAFAPAFGGLEDRRYLLPVAGAVLVAAVCGLALGARGRSGHRGGWWRQLPAPARALLTMGVVAGFLAFVVSPGRATLSGPWRLVTSALPLDPVGPELAAVAAFCAVATVYAVEAAQAWRAPLLPLVVPLVFTAAGCALSASVEAPPGWLAAAIVLVALALAAIHNGRMVAAAAVAVLVVGALALTPAVARLGRDSGFDGQTLFPQQIRPLVQTSPLAQFAAIRSGRLPLSLRVEADAAPGRMRYLSLDRFDGEYWTSVARYRRAGHRLPEPAGPGQAWTVVEHVTVDRAGPLGWLPASGRPQEVSVPGLGVDEQTGELALPEGAAVPAAYTIRSRVQVWDPDLVESATPATPPRERASAVPPDLAARALQVTRGEFGHPALALLAAHFAAEGGYSLEEAARSRSGHGVLHLRQLLESRRGTAEQYASAFAVLARALGYDTRVVVGFVPRAEGSAYRVVGGDIDAWPEVRFAGLGWVPYYPAPGQRSTAEQPKPPAPQPEPTPTFSRSDFVPPAGDGDVAAPGDRPGTRFAVTATDVAIAVAAAVLLLALVPLAKANRRRRRKRGEPNAQVLGAWQDTFDRFAEAGLRVPPSATPAEIATAAAHRFAAVLAHDALRLAALHDAAAFGPAPHGPTNAASAWRHAAHVRRELKRALGPARRLRAALSPHPFLRRRRR